MKRLILLVAVAILCLGTLCAQQIRIQKSTNRLYGLAQPKSSGAVKWVVKPTYQKILHIAGNAKYFYAQDRKSNLWGIISAEDEIVMPFTHQFIEISNLMTGNFSNYVKNYVESGVRTWQQKGEFEKTDAYRVRVNPTTRDAKVAQYTAEAKKVCLTFVNLMDVETALGSYDPDNETYLVETTIGNIVVPVPIAQARKFKEQFTMMSKDIEIDLYGWIPGIKSVDFRLKKKVIASYRAGNDAKYALTDIEYNFDPIVIDNGDGQAVPQSNIAATKVIEIGKSDVDTDIPVTRAEAENTFAVVIANENYQEAVNVPNALNDGEVFAKYCNKTLGLASSNIHLVKNATFNNLKREMNWLQQIAEAYDGNVKFIVYYAGHGIPDEQTQSAYLLPVDGVGNDISTGYSLKEFYAMLNKTKARSVMVFLDACFSGATRDGGMMMAARGVAIKTKHEKPVAGNLVVLSATQGAETAYPYNDKQHGLFTYYLLKKLQDSKGDVTLGELTNYVKDNVQKKSIVVNGKPQTPTVSASVPLGDSWKCWKLR